MIENILILDTETTGLSPEKGDKVIEIAAVLFNLKHKVVLQSFATLLPCLDNPVEKINHIKAEATQCKYAFLNELTKENIEEIWEDPESQSSIIYDEKITLDSILMEMSKYAEVCVAHNADFDKKFIATLPCGDQLLKKKWVCTKANFTWPVPLQRLRLEDICNGMKVPYVHAHRALADCLLLAQCFQKIEDLEQRFNRC